MPTAAEARFPFLDWPGPIPFTHQGWTAGAPANTLAAFRASVGLGYRYFETDLHATSDGVLVLSHDDDLGPLYGRPGKLSATRWSDLKAMTPAHGEPIARLDDLLEAFPDHRVNCDLKHDNTVGPTISLVRRAGCIDRLCIGAFDQSRLRDVRRALGPRLCTSMSPAEVVWWMAAVSPRLHRLVPAIPAAQVPARRGPKAIVTKRSLAAARARGVKVHVWTIDDPAEMDRLLDLGVDGLMTDRPDVLWQVFERRGLWVS